MGRIGSGLRSTGKCEFSTKIPAGFCPGALKMTDQVAGHEIAGHENARHENAGQTMEK